MFPYNEMFLQAEIDYRRERIANSWGRPVRRGAKARRDRRATRRQDRHVLAA